MVTPTHWQTFRYLTLSLGIATALAAATVFGTTTDPGPKSAKNRWTKSSKEDKHSAKEFIIQKTLPVTPGGTLTLDADRGSIEVTSARTNEVSIDVIRYIDEKNANEAAAILKHHQVAISKNGNDTLIRSKLNPAAAENITIEGVGFDTSDDIRQAIKNAVHRRLQKVHFRVTVPTEYNVELKTGGQSIKCGDLAGSAHCNTSGGRIQLGKITGPVHASTSGGSLQLASGGASVELKTSGGSIKSGDIQGNADVATSGGSIRLGKVAGRVSAKTSGGSILISEAGGAVEAVTSGGSVKATISKQPRADSYFATSGGSLNITLAQKLAFDLEHRGGNVSAPFFQKSKDRQPRSTKLNGGGPKLVTKGNVRFAFLNSK